MKKYIILIFIVTLAISTIFADEGHTETTTPNVTAFTHANVIPMTVESVQSDFTVIVEGGIITHVGPAHDIVIPEHAEIIDGTGKYLLPGLADMHIHPFGNALAENANQLNLYVAHGVTTVRSAASDERLLRWREKVQNNDIVGPTIYTAGPALIGYFERICGQIDTMVQFLPVILGVVVIIVMLLILLIFRKKQAMKRVLKHALYIIPFLVLTGFLLVRFNVVPVNAVLEVMGTTHLKIFQTEDEVLDEVERQHAAGFDSIKVYECLDEGQFRAILRRAQELNTYTVGHLSDLLTVDVMFEAGLNEVAHVNEFFSRSFQGYDYSYTIDPEIHDMDGFEIDWSKLPEFVAKTQEHDVAVTTTLYVDHVQVEVVENNEALLSQPEYTLLPAGLVDGWTPKNSMISEKQQSLANMRTTKLIPYVAALTKAMHDAGVLLIAGTDTSIKGTVPGHSLLKELEALVGAGLSPYESLLTGTKNAALVADRMVGDGNWGTISVGNRADLLMLNANPLDDIANIHDQYGVMVRGQWLSKEALGDLLYTLKASYEAE